MKKLATIAALAMFTAGAFAQGTITWGNTAANAIRFASGPTGGPDAGAKVAPGANYIVGLYIGAANATTPSALTLITTRTFATQATSVTHSFAGVFANTTTTVPAIATGTEVTYMIKAWSAGFASYEGALQNPTATTYAGVSGIGRGTLGGGSVAAFAASLTATGVAPGQVGAGAVAPFTIALVPEPASASLIGLGLASLLIFRRRK